MYKFVKNNFVVKILAPAKINLTLDITGKLTNGYHTVDMVMQSVNLCDEVTVEKFDNKNLSQNNIKLLCNKSNIPCDKSNTAYKAVELFSKKCNTICNVCINIFKNIPAQAGLAGGSTDGAGVLVALNELYNTNLTIDELAEIGAEIGADVPFCLYGGTMLATGIGTILEKINHNFNLNDYFILLCKPQINVSTPLAYKKSDSRDFSKNIHSTALINALKNNSESQFLSSLYNDFDSLLMINEVQHIKSIMEVNQSLKAVMSGSGPTVYGIYNDYNKAKSTFDILKQKYNDVYITTTCDNGCKIV